MCCLQFNGNKSNNINRQTQSLIITSDDFKYKRLTDCIPLLVNEETGIIRSISELPRQAYSPPFFYYKASVSNTIIFNGNDNLGITAGTSLNRSKAIVKALGEGIERYCAGNYSDDQFIHSSFSNLGTSAIHPNSFQLFLDFQFASESFPLERFTTDSQLFWMLAKDALTKKEFYVPATLVYCPFNPKIKETNIIESMSTGLAAHCSYEEASINGFLEVIERNNFMFTWLTKTSPIVVDKSTLTLNHKKSISIYERYGYEVNLSYNTGRDGIPSFIALIKGTRPYNVPILIAAATHLDPAQAITKCLDEIALMERLCQRKLLNPTSLAKKADFSKVNGLIDHIMLWFNPKIWEHANFLITNKEHISLKEIPNLFQSNPKDDLNYILDSINNLGYQTYTADITPEDMRTLGLHAVRALVPAYIPLNKNYQCRPLGAKYLTDYFKQEGIDEQDVQDYINPVPHPFA